MGRVPANEWVTIKFVVTDSYAEVFANGGSRGRVAGDYKGMTDALSIGSALNSVVTVKAFRLVGGKQAAHEDATGALRVPAGRWHVKWMSGEIDYVLGETSADVPSNGGHCRSPICRGNQMIMLWDNYPTVDRVTYLGHNTVLTELWHDRDSYHQGLPPFLVGLGQRVADAKGNPIVSVDSRAQWSAPVKLAKGTYSITAVGRWTAQIGTPYLGPEGLPGRDGLYGLFIRINGTSVHANSWGTFIGKSYSIEITKDDSVVEFIMNDPGTHDDNAGVITATIERLRQ